MVNNDIPDNIKDYKKYKGNCYNSWENTCTPGTLHTWFDTNENKEVKKFIDNDGKEITCKDFKVEPPQFNVDPSVFQGFIIVGGAAIECRLGF